MRTMIIPERYADPFASLPSVIATEVTDLPGTGAKTETAAELYWLITSILVGGPKAGTRVTNEPPIPQDIMFVESLMDVPTPDVWSFARILSFDFVGHNLVIAAQAAAFSRFHFYSINGNGLWYKYKGWWAAR